MKQKLSFDTRLDEDTLRKTLYIAKAEGKTLNNHILSLIRTNIAYYERIHGKITPKELADTDVAPFVTDTDEAN